MPFQAEHPVEHDVWFLDAHAVANLANHTDIRAPQPGPASPVWSS
jgi:hypothetical protein